MSNTFLKVMFFPSHTKPEYTFGKLPRQQSFPLNTVLCIGDDIVQAGKRTGGDHVAVLKYYDSNTSLFHLHV